MKGHQVLWTWMFLATVAIAVVAGARRDRRLLQDSGTTTSSIELPFPFEFSDPSSEGSKESDGGQPAQREGLDGPPQSLEPVSGGSSAKETSVHGGKDGKKKVDIHVEIEKPDIKGKLKDAKSAVKDKVAATKLEVEKKVDALKGKVPVKKAIKDKSSKKEEKTITIDPKEVKSEVAHQVDPTTVDPQTTPLNQVAPEVDAVAPSAQQLEQSIQTMAQHATDTLGDLRHSLNARLGDLDDKIAGDLKTKIKFGTEKAKEKLEEKKAAIECEKFKKNCPPEPESPPPEPDSPPPPSPSPPPPSPPPPPPDPTVVPSPPPPPSKSEVTWWRGVSPTTFGQQDFTAKMLEKLDKLAKLELLADQKLAAFGPSAESVVDNLNKLRKDARFNRDLAFEATRNYTLALARLAANQALSAQAAITNVASDATRSIINSRSQLARDSRTIREGIAAGTSPSDDDLTLPDPSSIPNLDAERGVSTLLDGNAALNAATAVAGAGVPDGALPSESGLLAGAIAGGLAIPTADMATALSNAQAALENLQSTLQTTLRNSAQSLPQVSGTLSASATMPNVTSIIQSQQDSSSQLQNALLGANQQGAAALQNLDPAAQSGALAQTIQQAQEALQNAQITLQSGAGAIATQPGYFLGSQINGIGAQLANAVQGLQSGNPLTAGLSAGLTPGMNSATTPLGDVGSTYSSPSSSTDLPTAHWDPATNAYTNNLSPAAPGPTSGDASCCEAPSSTTCSAFLQTFHIRVAPTADRWAQEFFCAKDSSGHGRLTPVSTAFASCLSLTSPDVRECNTDAECQLPAPLGHGPGYFCAEMPCCARVNTLLEELPQGILGNVSIRAQTAGSGPRKICRPDAVAFSNAGTCSARTAPSTIDNTSGLSISFNDPITQAPLFNASLLATQADLGALPRIYANIDIAAQDYAAAMDPSGYARLRNALADQAQAAVATITNITDILNLRSQLDSAIVNFAYSLAGQPPREPAAAPESAPAGAMAPAVTAADEPTAPTASAAKPLGSPTAKRMKKGSSHKKPSKPHATTSAPAPLTEVSAKPSSLSAGAPDPIISHGPAPAHEPVEDNTVTDFTLGLGSDGVFTMQEVEVSSAVGATPAPAGQPLVAMAPKSAASSEGTGDEEGNPVGLYGRAFSPPAPTSGTLPGIVHELVPSTVGWLNTTNAVTTGLLQPAEHFVNGTATNEAFQATVNAVIDNTVGNGPYRGGLVDGAALFGASSPEPQTVDKRTGQGQWIAPPDSYNPPRTPVVGTVNETALAAGYAPPTPASNAVQGILQAFNPDTTLGRLPPTQDVVNAVLG